MRLPSVMVRFKDLTVRVQGRQGPLQVRPPSRTLPWAATLCTCRSPPQALCPHVCPLPRRVAEVGAYALRSAPWRAAAGWCERLAAPRALHAALGAAWRRQDDSDARAQWAAQVGGQPQGMHGRWQGGGACEGAWWPDACCGCSGPGCVGGWVGGARLRRLQPPACFHRAAWRHQMPARASALREVPDGHSPAAPAPQVSATELTYNGTPLDGFVVERVAAYCSQARGPPGFPCFASRSPSFSVSCSCFPPPRPTGVPTPLSLLPASNAPVALRSRPPCLVGGRPHPRTHRARDV